MADHRAATLNDHGAADGMPVSTTPMPTTTTTTTAATPIVWPHATAIPLAMALPSLPRPEELTHQAFVRKRKAEMNRVSKKRVAAKKAAEALAMLPAAAKAANTAAATAIAAAATAAMTVVAARAPSPLPAARPPTPPPAARPLSIRSDLRDMPLHVTDKLAPVAQLRKQLDTSIRCMDASTLDATTVVPIDVHEVVQMDQRDQYMTTIVAYMLGMPVRLGQVGVFPLGKFTKAHAHVMCVVNLLLCGEKWWQLAPPGHLGADFATNVCFQFKQKAGHWIYIPAGWSHEVTTTGVDAELQVACSYSVMLAPEPLLSEVIKASECITEALACRPGTTGKLTAGMKKELEVLKTSELSILSARAAAVQLALQRAAERKVEHEARKEARKAEQEARKAEQEREEQERAARAAREEQERALALSILSPVMDPAMLRSMRGPAKSTGLGAGSRQITRLDAWRVLGVPVNASSSDCLRAYKKRIVRVHPDKCLTRIGQFAARTLGEAKQILCSSQQVFEQ